MTIYSVTRMWSRSSGSAEDDKGKSIKTAWAEGWQVSHSANATEPEIIAASGLPKMRDLYPGTFARCKKIGQSTRLGPCLSIVPIDYVGESGPDSVTDSPLNKRPSIEWRSRTSQEAVDRVTPTFKIKRNRIEEVYGAMFEGWEGARRPVVWYPS